MAGQRKDHPFCSWRPLLLFFRVGQPIGAGCSAGGTSAASSEGAGSSSASGEGTVFQKAVAPTSFCGGDLGGQLLGADWNVVVRWHLFAHEALALEECQLGPAAKPELLPALFLVHDNEIVDGAGVTFQVGLEQGGRARLQEAVGADLAGIARLGVDVWLFGQLRPRLCVRRVDARVAVKGGSWSAFVDGHSLEVHWSLGEVAEGSLDLHLLGLLAAAPPFLLVVVVGFWCVLLRLEVVRRLEKSKSFGGWDAGVFFHAAA